MKILFLCGSLASGRDGVGDYTLTFAIELIRKGYKTGIIALNDPHLSAELESNYKFEGFISLPLLRLPSKWSSKKRFSRMKRWIELFNPDWVSLQYVPFSFHPKGLPFGFTKQLLNLGTGWHWHIMFHELWVGMSVNASRKDVLWGWLQRRIIHLMILKLHPTVIHTQTWLYQSQLLKVGASARLLPLFSNIPVVHRAGSDPSLKKEQREIILVLFGSIHSYAKVASFVKELVHYKKNKAVDICLQMVGRSGQELSTWIKICDAEGIKISILGELTPECVSETLQNASIGITTTALAMIQKSSAVAVMREHGLPVICIAKRWKPRGMQMPEPPNGIFEFYPGIIENCIKLPKDHNAVQTISKVAQNFIESITYQP